ncbi:MAG: peptidoglycan-associated lipoprotein Pal [Rhodocyclaceae bacterium]|jgi:peptidoglycan-associated lipoprotein|nr:peptidoglycan-associated lipoprotein Pal [Rhodocyclaceae bacterium]
MYRALLAALALSLLAACSSQPPAPEQRPSGVEDRQPSTVSSTAPVSQETLDPYSVAALKDPKSILSKREVFFDFDEYVIKDEFKPLIAAHAKFLIANPKFKMLIQGNADERGSREYNLALGQKRAEAVKKALTLLGAREDQIESVSLGEEKPRCTEQTEECWAKNRRDDILYSGEF